ncbi:MAG: right-handed parallel beta-helix repeat-containing protein [Phycisphaeraceae bacterium]|nr:right-handed parallel beta-helix repeat-containing protein [Phycisphaeraceae bacterium]
MRKRTRHSVLIVLALGLGVASAMAVEHDFSPKPDERQLPHAMHSAMAQLPGITVGPQDADLIGSDNRALQAAIDYIAGLGGGTVNIGPGTYVMRDSLHLRSNVVVRGHKGKTILRQAATKVSPLAMDGDFGEQQFTVTDPAGFAVGYGVAIWDDRAGGFHTTVARITGQNGNTFSIDKPIMADCLISRQAQAATVFPVVSGYDLEGARIENLVIDGNRDSTIHLNGCRGAGIFLYRGFGTVIQGCTVRNYNGDGISFQQSNDVKVTACVSEGNVSLGLHPGSGSQRPTIQDCIARGNGTDGLFLCWRVRHGLFENNLFEKNGQFGISIGHKDSDNLLRGNMIRENLQYGVFFRNETLPMAAHRNRLEENIIENNGKAGICVRGQTNDLVFKKNVIRETRTGNKQTQTIGVQLDKQVGKVTFDDNKITAKTAIDDQRIVDSD